MAFRSAADDLVPGDTNRAFDIFVRDRAAGTTERVSVDSTGAEGDGDCFSATLSADGRFVVFDSLASNLVAGDVNGAVDVFLHDRNTGTTELVSVDSNGAQGDAGSGAPSISADGRRVAFVSSADDLDPSDVNRSSDLFVRDRAAGTTTRVTVTPTGGGADGATPYGRISADGSTVACSSWASNLVAGDTNQTMDVFVVDVATLATERVSVGTAGAQADFNCYLGGLSADGTVVCFESFSDNLVAGDTNGCVDCFVRDRGSATTERVSVAEGGGQCGQMSESPTLSADGRLVSFCSWAENLVLGDWNRHGDIFVHDRATGRVDRVSVASSGRQADADCDSPVISADGRIVAFRSFADDLVAGDANGDYDVFANERCLVDASWSNYGAGLAGTFGVPPLVARVNPVLGRRIAIDLGNSYGLATTDLLLVGLGRTSIGTHRGGVLLVIPLLTQFSPLAPGGTTFQGDLPGDATLCGVTVDLQAIEVDPGALNGLSFTRGLELTLGR